VPRVTLQVEGGRAEAQAAEASRPPPGAMTPGAAALIAVPRF
jgi:hypothetical protein